MKVLVEAAVTVMTMLPGDDGGSDEGVLHIVYCAHWFVSDTGHCQQLERLCQILLAVFILS